MIENSFKIDDKTFFLVTLSNILFVNTFCTILVPKCWILESAWHPKSSKWRQKPCISISSVRPVADLLPRLCPKVAWALFWLILGWILDPNPLTSRDPKGPFLVPLFVSADVYLDPEVSLLKKNAMRE